MGENLQATDWRYLVYMWNLELRIFLCVCLFDKELCILQVNKKKTISLKKKNGHKVWRGTSQRRYPDGQFVHEKILSIINHREMQIKTTTPGLQWLKLKGLI